VKIFVLGQRSALLVACTFCSQLQRCLIFQTFHQPTVQEFFLTYHSVVFNFAVVLDLFIRCPLVTLLQLITFVHQLKNTRRSMDVVQSALLPPRVVRPSVRLSVCRPKAAVLWPWYKPTVWLI